jgi:predicted nucleic acid-binding Zn ribbon protein
MRRAGPRPVSFALDGMIDALAPPTLLAAVQRVWPDVAGRFADFSEPVAERNGELVVACDSSVWASELDLMSELVVARLNKALGRPAVARLKPRATRTGRPDLP